MKLWKSDLKMGLTKHKRNNLLKFDRLFVALARSSARAQIVNPGFFPQNML
jgi:hypothetical protein